MSSLTLPNYRARAFQQYITNTPKNIVNDCAIWGRDLCLMNRGSISLGVARKRCHFRVYAMCTPSSSSSALKMNLNEYMVTLEKPLGIRFALSVDGYVFVHSLKKGGNAEKSRIIMVGDTVKKASESSGGKLIEIKDFGDAGNLTKEQSGSCSLVLERPFSPFPIHQLHPMNDLDHLFNKGHVPVTTWNKSVLASNLRASTDTSGNSGFVIFNSKFLNSKGWNCLSDENGKAQSKLQNSIHVEPISQLVTMFSDDSGDVEWGHGSFPLEEYMKALDRSKGDQYYNHSLGMRYSKITEQIYVGSCIQNKTDVETLSRVVGVSAVLNFQSVTEAENWGINSKLVNESCQQSNILMINYPIRYEDFKFEIIEDS